MNTLETFEHLANTCIFDDDNLNKQNHLSEKLKTALNTKNSNSIKLAISGTYYWSNNDK